MQKTKLEYKTSLAALTLDQLIRKSGYKSKNQFGGECTSFVCEQTIKESDSALLLEPENSDTDVYKRANKMVEECNKVLNEKLNDFIMSCRSAIGTHNTVTSTWTLKPTIYNYQFGFLAPLVNSVIKKETEPVKEDLSNLGWIGTERKRGNFFVKLTSMISKEDYTLHKVVDKKGNRGLFYHYKMKDHKGGEHADDDTVNYTDSIAMNDCFLMTATPSRHQISKYDGGKETYFNRVTVLENKGRT
jgi:hypothetical protein